MAVELSRRLTVCRPFVLHPCLFLLGLALAGSPRAMSAPANSDLFEVTMERAKRDRLHSEKPRLLHQIHSGGNFLELVPSNLKRIVSRLEATKIAVDAKGRPQRVLENLLVVSQRVQNIWVHKAGALWIDPYEESVKFAFRVVSQQEAQVLTFEFLKSNTWPHGNREFYPQGAEPLSFSRAAGDIPNSLPLAEGPHFVVLSWPVPRIPSATRGSEKASARRINALAMVMTVLKEALASGIPRLVDRELLSFSDFFAAEDDQTFFVPTYTGEKWIFLNSAELYHFAAPTRAWSEDRLLYGVLRHHGKNQPLIVRINSTDLELLLPKIDPLTIELFEEVLLDATLRISGDKLTTPLDWQGPELLGLRWPLRSDETGIETRALIAARILKTLHEKYLAIFASKEFWIQSLSHPPLLHALWKQHVSEDAKISCSSWLGVSAK